MKFEEVKHLLQFDQEDRHFFENGNYHYDRGCVRARYGRKNLPRMLMSCPDDKVVDHIDGDTGNNKKSNLRIIHKIENARNRKYYKNQIYHGVYYNEFRNEYTVHFNRTSIYHDNKHSAIIHAYDYVKNNWDCPRDQRTLSEVLQNNEQEYTSDFKPECDMCNLKFASNYTLKIHKKRKH